MSKCETCVHKAVCETYLLYAGTYELVCKHYQTQPDGAKCGEWLDSPLGDRIVKCSLCDAKYYVGNAKERLCEVYKYCPHCGTKMEEPND